MNGIFNVEQLAYQITLPVASASTSSYIAADTYIDNITAVITY